MSTAQTGTVVYGGEEADNELSEIQYSRQELGVFDLEGLGVTTGEDASRSATEPVRSQTSRVAKHWLQVIFNASTSRPAWNHHFCSAQESLVAIKTIQYAAILYPRAGL